MKRYIIATLLLAYVCFAKGDISFTKLSSHKGDIWTIQNFRVIDTVKHGYVITNALIIKWNIKKGRMRVECGVLCDDDDRFIIRVFDKDGLPIDYVTVIKPNTALSGYEYIIPAVDRKDIAWMEILPFNTNWEPKYEVLCDEGYTLDTDNNTCLEDVVCPDGYTLDTDNNTCLEDVVCPDGYTLDTDNNTCLDIETNCPPRLQDSDGNCLLVRYSN